MHINTAPQSSPMSDGSELEAYYILFREKETKCILTT